MPAEPSLLTRRRSISALRNALAVLGQLHHVDRRRGCMNVVRMGVGDVGNAADDHERDHDSNGTDDHRVAHDGVSTRNEKRPSPIAWARLNYRLQERAGLLPA